MSNFPYRTAIGILGIIALSVMFPFALSNPNLVNHWLMWVMADILVVNILIVMLDEIAS